MIMRGRRPFTINLASLLVWWQGNTNARYLTIQCTETFSSIISKINLLNSYLLLFLNLGKLQIVRSSGSPRFYKKDVRNDLECHFSGWPPPREVQWNKNDKIITNGTESIYHSEDRKWKKGEETLRSTLHLPPWGEEQEGDYKCSARNSIPGWESEAIGRSH